MAVLQRQDLLRAAPALQCHADRTLSRRHRRGRQEFLKATIDTAVSAKAIGPAEFEWVIVDITVQEKAIAHPVDSRLLEIARHKVVAAARRACIESALNNPVLSRRQVGC
jgi:IS5 family transposase